MPVNDIVVHYLRRKHGKLPSDFPEDERPPSERFQINDRLWIGRLEDSAALRVYEACTPRTHGFELPRPAFRQICAYGLEVPLPFALTKQMWDPNTELRALVSLSRLIHPTSASFRLAARVETDSNGILKWVSPAELAGVEMDAYTDPANHRDWLVLQELQELRSLITALDGSSAPERLWRAFWYHEYAARTYEADIRWTLIAAGLEALVHTDRNKSTREFKVRCSALARAVGVSGFGEDEADTAWDMRSGLAHGQNLGTLLPEHLKLYVLMESVLRLALLRAFREPIFRDIFKTADTIRQKWPIG